MSMRLRTLLLVVGALAIWLAWYSNRAIAQRRAVEWVWKNGGGVSYLNMKELIGSREGLEQAVEATWLVRLFGVDFVASVNYVWIVERSLDDIKPLGTLTTVRELDLTGSTARDFSPLAKLTQLTSLDLNESNIQDITPLKNLRRLVRLDVSGTEVIDLTPLSGVSDLKSLDICRTSVVTLQPLSKLEKLEYLLASGSLIQDLLPIKGSKNLEGLFIGGTKVTDLESIYGLRNLRLITFAPGQLSNNTIDNLRQELPNCAIESHR